MSGRALLSRRIAAASSVGQVAHEEPITELQAGLPNRGSPHGQLGDSLRRSCRAAAWVQGTRQRKWLLTCALSVNPGSTELA